MSILVDNKPIEVKLRYVDQPYPGGAVGAKVFMNDEEEEEWVNRENKRRSEKAMELKALKQEVPPELEKDAQDEVKELLTFWKRTDWGTQSRIFDQCSNVNSLGEVQTDWTKLRALQMENLMVGWNLKTPDGDPIEINSEIVSRLDYSVALALLSKYDEVANPSEEELENLG